MSNLQEDVISKNIEAFLDSVRIDQGLGSQAEAATWLVNEKQEVTYWLNELASLQQAIDDPTELVKVLKKCEVALPGGKGAFNPKALLFDFFNREVFPDAVVKLLTGEPDMAAIQAFIEVAVSNGVVLRRENNRPWYLIAAYIAALLLSAKHPDLFFPYRDERVKVLYKLFLDRKPPARQNTGTEAHQRAIQIFEASRDLRPVAATLAQVLGHPENPMWLLAGLAAYRNSRTKTRSQMNGVASNGSGHLEAQATSQTPIVEPTFQDPVNLIFFGPPGTGKTYRMPKEAVRLVEPGVAGPAVRNALLTRFEELRADGRIEFVTFHQSYGYEDFVEGLRPVLVNSRIGATGASSPGGEGKAAPGSSDIQYEIVDGIFKRIALEAAWEGLKESLKKGLPPKADKDQCRKHKRQAVLKALENPSASFEFTDQTPQYVLTIDEINRGNISKIFGELITLIESDRRLGHDNQLWVTLPYSGQTFAVPPNLHILGTMNTADRSIALLDAALRRRFQFEELMPSEVVIRETLARSLQERKSPNDEKASLSEADKGYVEVVARVFRNINQRILFLYDRDHQIGHSYFLKATDPLKLRDTFVNQIIPLLQEYFYGAWDKICLVLGCPFDPSGNAKDNGKSGIIRAERLDEKAILGFDHPDYDPPVAYEVNPRFLTLEDSKEVADFFSDKYFPVIREESALDVRLETSAPEAANQDNQ